jgi:hypothetical protein
MTQKIRDRFDVKMVPQEGAHGGAVAVGRMSIDKRFHGALDATSLGEMLAHRTAVQGSAGYVAMEQVTGTLAGRTGTFVLQHTGVMDQGAQSLTITVVPDSATGELRGLTGRMAIEIVDGQHFYEFEYDLP